MAYLIIFAMFSTIVLTTLALINEESANAKQWDDYRDSDRPDGR